MSTFREVLESDLNENYNGPRKGQMIELTRELSISTGGMSYGYRAPAGSVYKIVSVDGPKSDAYGPNKSYYSIMMKGGTPGGAKKTVFTRDDYLIGGSYKII